MQAVSSNESDVKKFIEYAVFVLVNLALAIFFFSATQQVIRSQVSQDSFDGSDVVTWTATAVPYLLCAIVLNFVFAIWALYSAVRWKSYVRLILLALISALWMGVPIVLRNWRS